MLGVPPERLGKLVLRRHSLDGRHRAVKVQLRVEAGIDGGQPVDEPPRWEAPPLPRGARTVVIVGCGPAGMFAALRCLTHHFTRRIT